MKHNYQPSKEKKSKTIQQSFSIQVTQKVENREALMATIIYAVLPDRLKRYSFSYPYEYASPTFCMTKPLLRPQFLSLYYPLANEVWLSILLALLLVPVVLVKVCYFKIG